MYDFNKNLNVGETILYTGRPTPGKGNKSIKGPMFLIIFCLLVEIIMIWSVVAKVGDGADGIGLSFIILLVVVLIFQGIGVYSIIYNKFLKDKQVKDDYYCLTNERVLKYEESKDLLVYGKLATYQAISVINAKDKYGDVSFSIILNDAEVEENPGILLEKMKNKDHENMSSIMFESIENPYQIAKLAKDARDKLTNNFQNQYDEIEEEK